MRKLLTFLSTCLIATQLVIPHAVSAQSNLSFQAKGSHKKHHCCKQGKRGKRGKQGLQGPAGAPGASTTNPSTTSFTYANLVYKGAEEVMPPDIANLDLVKFNDVPGSLGVDTSTTATDGLIKITSSGTYLIRYSINDIGTQEAAASTAPNIFLGISVNGNSPADITKVISKLTGTIPLSASAEVALALSAGDTIALQNLGDAVSFFNTSGNGTTTIFLTLIKVQ